MNTIEAIYEKGVFRPVEKIELTEGERVKITVEVTVHRKKIVPKNFPILLLIQEFQTWR